MYKLSKCQSQAVPCPEGPLGGEGPEGPNHGTVSPLRSGPHALLVVETLTHARFWKRVEMRTLLGRGLQGHTNCLLSPVPRSLRWVCQELQGLARTMLSTHGFWFS